MVKLCKGRIYNLREVIKFISADKSKTKFWVDDKMWLIKLIYLTDIFGHLNELNTNMQNRNEKLLTTMDKLYAFFLKSKLWPTNFAQGMFKIFPLTQTATRAVNRNILKKSIGSHLEMLQQRTLTFRPEHIKI